MGAKSEVEQQIITNWQDKQVAKWVVHRLPLLEKANTHSPCPILSISTSEGPNLQVGDDSDLKDFKNTPKLVMSGGFEGTKGHLKAVSEMKEVRILTQLNMLVVVMLEPDSYISEHKKREPIVDIEQRVDLWSTSGLVDTVILLPKKDGSVSTEDHYANIHKHIQPAKWCANVENPYHYQIIMRQDLDIVSPVRLFVHQPEAHTSFLHSTKNMNLEELKNSLQKYSLECAKKPSSYILSGLVPPESEAEIIYDSLIQGLD